MKRLSRLGFRVFAGVRRAEDAESARNAANGTVTPLMIDITDGAMIASAVKTVEQVVAERGLVRLVNNAGVVKPGPLELQPLDDFRCQLEVNLIGLLAVIQAFLPLLRRGGGRIVNVGSVGGLLVRPIQGAYSASKFGLEALSDALRLELRQWQIPVSHAADVLADLEHRRHAAGPAAAQDRRHHHPARGAAGGYDLVVFGSPTWWLTTCMPVRSYLQSPAAKAVLDGKPFAGVSVSRRYYKGNLGDIKKLGEQAGGRWTGSTHLVSDGNQVMSMSSWLVFMRKNEPRSRYFGVPLPRPNLKADYAEGAKRYADELAEKVFGSSPVGAANL